MPASEDLIVNIKAKLDQAKRDVQQFERDLAQARAEVTVRANTTEAEREINSAFNDQSVEVDVAVAGDDDVEDLGADIDALDDTDVAVAADVEGDGDVQTLGDDIDGLDDTDVTVTADVEGDDDVQALGDDVGALADTDVMVAVEVEGDDDVQTLAADIDGLNDVEVEVSAQVQGDDDVQSLADDISGLSDTDVSVTATGTAQAKQGIEGVGASAVNLGGLASILRDKLGAETPEGLGSALESLGLDGTAGVAIGGIGAAAALMYEAGKKAEELGLKVGEFSDATGTTAEQASRLIEVAGDVGVGVDTIQAAIGRLNKNLDPEKLHNFGIEIAHAKDGTVDANGTFLNAIDALHGMDDAGEQAAAGAALFGKGWQGLAELVGMGADDIKRRLAAVGDQQVISEQQVKESRDFRDTMDDLTDTLQGFVLEIGKAVLPGLKTLATQATDTAQGLSPLIDGLSTVISLAGKLPKPIKFGFDLPVNPVGAFKEAVSAATDVIDTNSMSLDDLQKMLRKAGVSASDAAAILQQWHDANGESRDIEDESKQAALKLADATTDAGDAAAVAARQAEDHAGTLERQQQAADAAKQAMVDHAKAVQDDADKVVADAKALQDAAKALTEQADAAMNAADSQLALNATVDAFAAATANTIKVQGDSKSTAADVKKAIDDERDALIDAAKAQVKLSDDQAAALGITQSATTKIDLLNTSLETQAASATPAARKAAYDYILQVNQIPADKATEIQALVDQGKLDEANSMINDVSRTRQASVIADADTTVAEAKLNEAARARTAWINAQVAAGIPVSAPGGGVKRLAAGGPAKAGEVSLVGEHGPEMVHWGADGTVIPAGPTADLLGGDTTTNNHLTVVVQSLPTSRELATWIARMKREGYGQ